MSKRIEEKIDKLDSRLDGMAITLAKQEVNLETHMKRSDALEAIVLPMKRKMDMADGILKAIGLISVLSGIAGVIIQVLQWIQ